MKNKIFKIKNLISIAGVLVLINIGIGCVDLEEAPYDFVGPTNFYGSVPQIEAAFASSMNRIYQEWSAYSYGWWAFANDDQMYDGSLVIDDDFASYFWINHYQAIADLNPAIAALNADVLGTSASQGEKDELMAQAKFLRAFNYFNLVRLYGDRSEGTRLNSSHGGISRMPSSA